MKLDEVPTPALCVDADAVRHNIVSMAEFFRDRPCALRPHFKAHKTPAIARLQAEAGAAGFTCATVGEAEVLARHGHTDLLIANEILDQAKVERVRSLCDVASLTVAIDSLAGVELVRDVPVGALVDVNVGMPRCGCAPEDALEIARAIADTEIHLRGVMGYEGHVQFVDNPGKREHMASKSMATLLGVAEALREDGHDVSVVSGGGTGTYTISGATPGVTEIQAGSYVLMDTQYAGVRPEFRETLGVLTTVLTVGPSHAVLDAGLKAVAVDHGPPQLQDGFPATVMYLSDEHTAIAKQDGFSGRPGDRVWLRTAHVDPTVNLHDRLYVHRGPDVVDVWRVEARGYEA